MASNIFPGSTKCKRPSFNSHRGRTWDVCTIIDINGKEHKGWLDTSWGYYCYFQDENEDFRKVNMSRFNEKNLVFDFRDLDTDAIKMSKMLRGGLK